MSEEKDVKQVKEELSVGCDALQKVLYGAMIKNYPNGIETRFLVTGLVFMLGRYVVKGNAGAEATISLLRQAIGYHRGDEGKNE